MSVGIRETEHYNSVLEIRGGTVSFLGIHQWEPDIYINPTLHLQCCIVSNGLPGDGRLDHPILRLEHLALPGSSLGLVTVFLYT